jgi:hypothetical protein
MTKAAFNKKKALHQEIGLTATFQELTGEVLSL